MMVETALALLIYPVVLDLVRHMAPRLRELRVKSAPLAEQLERSLTSIPLNVAEGAYSRGRTRAVRFHSAAGSAREALACWETAEAFGWVVPLDDETMALFQRVIGTLVRLSR